MITLISPVVLKKTYAQRNRDADKSGDMLACTLLHQHGKGRLIIARCGFIAAVRSILKLRPAGLVTAGVPCSSYVFINRATAGRSQEWPLGDESRPHVHAANKNLACIGCGSGAHAQDIDHDLTELIRIACRMGLLLLLAVVRQIYWFVEQPSSSLLELDPYISHVLGIVKIIQPVYRKFLLRPELLH